MKSWLSVLVGLLGIGSANYVQGWNVLDTNAGKSDAKLVATIDLKGSACVVNLEGGAAACKQTRSAAPVLVKLMRSHTTYPDQHQYGTLYLVPAEGQSATLWNADEYKIAPDGKGFRIVMFELKKGRGGWLEIYTVEHALPGKNDTSFRPGPPLTNHYVYADGTYKKGPK